MYSYRIFLICVYSLLFTDLTLQLVPLIARNPSVCTGHYEGRAMPSAGLLPLLQSVVCAATNPCHAYEQLDPGRDAPLVYASRSFDSSFTHRSSSVCFRDSLRAVVVVCSSLNTARHLKERDSICLISALEMCTLTANEASIKRRRRAEL